jgi:2-methylcitrate dehydratase PrpD
MTVHRDEAWRGASHAIGQFVTRFTPHVLCDAHYAAVGRALVDTVSVAFAGYHEPAASAARAYLAGRQAEQQASLWGPSNVLPLEEAAFYNGVAGHVIDFDDVSSPMRGHPSIVLLPALTALAEAFHKTGAEFAAAYVVGFEVIVRLSRPMISDHYANGWHATASVGVLGATAACANLLGLTQAQTINALGLAVAQAAGTRANFGTMAKSFQAGNAAACAVRATLLAACGFDSSPEAMDGKYGFMSLYANNECLADSLMRLGDAELEIISSGIEIKKYPLCYATHRTIDGVLDLREAHGLSLSAVERVHITSNFRATAPLIYSAPQTGLEAKFSMQYAVAAALADGYVRLRSFTQESVRRADIQAFFPRVTVQEDQGPAFPRWNRIVLHTAQGHRIEKKVTTLRGGPDSPLTDAQLRDKASDCFSFVGIDCPSTFLDAAMHLKSTGMRNVMRTLPSVPASP